jgi:hypothetical protein
MDTPLFSYVSVPSNYTYEDVLKMEFSSVNDVI